MSTLAGTASAEPLVVITLFTVDLVSIPSLVEALLLLFIIGCVEAKMRPVTVAFMSDFALFVGVIPVTVLLTRAHFVGARDCLVAVARTEGFERVGLLVPSALSLATVRHVDNRIYFLVVLLSEDFMRLTSAAEGVVL